MKEYNGNEICKFVAKERVGPVGRVEQGINRVKARQTRVPSVVVMSEWTPSKWIFILTV